MRTALSFAAIALLSTTFAGAQNISLPRAAATDPAALTAAIPTLAAQAIALYQDPDRNTYLNILFRLQVDAHQYSQANDTLHTLHELRATHAPQSLGRLMPFEIDVAARLKQNSAGLPYDQAFQQSFNSYFLALDDSTACRSFQWFGIDLPSLQDNIKTILAAQSSKDTISLHDALNLLFYIDLRDVFAQITPLLPSLINADDARRYIIDTNVLVKTPDGASIAVMFVRPRTTKSLPAIFEFTIYADDPYALRQARTAASHGYSGVIGFTRGKGRSPDEPIAYEHDGDDARAVINWIAQQSWSDGRVGMNGGSYSGFTEWAAAKHPPAALKTLMAAVAAAPGIDVPMEGNISLNYLYPFPIYTTTNKTLNSDYYNQTRWNALNHNQYVTGGPYRDMDKIDGTPNPVFRRWLDHPSYDSYWQSMIPYRDEFAAIDIPILTTDGYLEGQGLSSRYYFTEHTHYNLHADHYYVIGPYTHFGAQGQPFDVVNGYSIDPLARIDIDQLRFDWFAYIFQGAPKPALLKDRVNYEVMGANLWKHTSTIEAMSNASLRLHLSTLRSGEFFRLTPQQQKTTLSVSLEINLADRTDVDRPTSELIINKTLDAHNGLAFVSDPITQPTEFSGLFSGLLDILPNKRDMDLKITLYELTAKGDYVQLTYYKARASYIKDPSHRNLLTPNQRHQLIFTSGRLINRKLEPGSRLVAVLSVIKQPDTQINYGTGKPVSEETLSDAKIPLRIKWFTTSYLDIPIWRDKP